MPADFTAAFATLKTVFAKHVKKLAVKTDTPVEYTLVTQKPSPFPQHKGQPMYFGMVKVGKAYVSFHLLPLYMDPVLTETISPELQKRMQGKACFNFKSDPEPELIRELKQLTEDGFRRWREKQWV